MQQKFSLLLTLVCLASVEAAKVEVLWREAACFGKLGATIEALSHQINAELHLYINLNESGSSEMLSSLLRHQKRDVAQLIVTQDTNATDFELRGKFPSQVLTIAFVSPANMLQVRQKVNQLLWMLHFRHVVFVFGDAVGGTQPLHTLFTACWRHGFVYVAALLPDGSLYSYEPFPAMRLVSLPDVAAYGSRMPLQDFHGRKLRSPISNSSPRCYHYVDRGGKIATGGYFYKIVQNFLQHHNGTFEELVLSTYELDIDDILRAFDAGQIDIVANLYYMNSKYAYSDVICNYNVYIMAPFALPIPEFYYFIKPFKATLWALILGMLAYAVVLLSLIYWRQREDHRFVFGATMLEVFKLLLFLPHYKRRVRTRIQLLTFVLLLLTGFLLTNFYLAKLSSLLATTVYGNQINNFDDIAKTNLWLPQTELDRNYLQKLSHIHPGVLDRIWVTTPEEVHNLRRNLNTSFLHSGVEDKIHFFLYQQKFLKVPFFRRINEILYSLPIFIPMPHGSPYLQLLNIFLRRIMESGILKKIINENEEDGILSGEIRFFCSSLAPQPRLTLKHFVLPFALWGGGLLSAGCVFLVEVYLAKGRIKGNKAGIKRVK